MIEVLRVFRPTRFRCYACGSLVLSPYYYSFATFDLHRPLPLHVLPIRGACVLACPLFFACPRLIRCYFAGFVLQCFCESSGCLNVLR